MPKFESHSGEYSGRETLEDLASASNYNDYLAGLISGLASRGSNVLDFGAGTGTFMRLMDNFEYRLSAVETDAVLASGIEARGFSVAPRVADFPDESFDLIYSLNVLEHIENDADAFAELASRVKVGGRIAIYVPAFQHLYSKFDASIGHYRRYSKKGLERLAYLDGLRIERLTYEDPLGYFAALAFKILRKKTPGKGSIALYDRLAFPISKALQPALKSLFGKNLFLVAIKES